MRYLKYRRKCFRALLQAFCLLWIVGCGRVQPIQVPGGNTERGKTAIEHYSCVACHSIPGVSGPSGNIGSSLDNIAKRAYIAGVLANTPVNMVRWLRNPPGIDPHTVMPNMGLNDADAKDVAAYLYTLD